MERGVAEVMVVATMGIVDLETVASIHGTVLGEGAAAAKALGNCLRSPYWRDKSSRGGVESTGQRRSNGSQETARTC